MASRSITRPFPGFSSIYYLSGKSAGRPFHADIEMTDEQSVKMPRAEIILPYPIQARWAMGRKKPGDVIWTTLAIPVLVSERLVTILRNAGFHGFSTYAVNLVGHDGAPIPGYHGLSIYGRCGPIDESKAVQVPRIFPGGVFPVWLGMYFDPDTWDGSDLFMPDDPKGAIFITNDVKQAFEKARIKNVQFTPLTEEEVIKLRPPPQARVT